MKRLTWNKPDGSWGVNGVELSTLTPAAYGAMYKLMRMELQEEASVPALFGACCDRCCGFEDDGRRSECAECPIRALAHAAQRKMFFENGVV